MLSPYLQYFQRLFMKFTRSFENNLRMRALLSKLARIKGELAWLLLGQAMAAVGGLVSVRLMTGLLSPAVYGELALGMTAALLVNQTLFGPISNGITRFYAPAMEQNEVASYLNAARKLVLNASGIVVLVAICSATALLLSGRTKWIALIMATLLYAVLNGYNGILSGIQNAARQRSVVALHQGIETWTRFLVAAVLVLWLGATSSVTMVGYTAGIIVVLISQYAFFQKIARLPSSAFPRTNWHDQILKYSWPFCTWSIFTWAQLSSDRWALGLFVSTKEVGLYAVLSQLGNYPISMASTMAIQLLAPIFYQHAGDGYDSGRNAKVDNLSWRLTFLMLAITGAAFLAAMLFHAQMFQVFVARKYASVSPLLSWMLLASGIFSASQTIELNLMSQMKTHTLITAKITTALLGVMLNFAGARWYGISGVVGAGVLVSACYFIWMVVLSKMRK